MFPDRLRLARSRAGLSLRDLSAAIGSEVSAQAIGKYENGEMMPSAKVLTLLGKSLGVSLDFLMSSQVAALEGVEFRDSKNTGAKQRSQIEAIVIEEVERYLMIEDILEIDDGGPDLGNLVNRHVERFSDADELAGKLRSHWNLGCDPLPNITGLLEDRGFKIVEADLPDRVDGLTCLVKLAGNRASLPVIVVRKDAPLERRRFTLCHELAHRVIATVGPGLDKEKVMHQFSGALLMPKVHLEVEAGGRPRRGFARAELIRMKHIYGVSAVALLMRMVAIGILSDSGLSFAFQTYARGWRTLEPQPIQPQPGLWGAEKPERFMMLVYRALAEHVISVPRAAQLLRKSLGDIELAMKGPALGEADRH
jgi:transcriptional regulator with XRE-family HTH domain/Zn-dependent peptidase ImmA (M78 family)